MCTSYHAEKGELLQEENIIDAAVEDKKTVTELAVANRNEQIAQKDKPSSVIASVPEDSNRTDVDEFDPYFSCFWYYYRVVFIKTLPDYNSLPYDYRCQKLLPPKAPGVPAYTLVNNLFTSFILGSWSRWDLSSLFNESKSFCWYCFPRTIFYNKYMME